MKIKIKHIDGKTNVIAKVLPWTKYELEYKFEGVTWGRTLNEEEAIELGIIKKLIK